MLKQQSVIALGEGSYYVEKNNLAVLAIAYLNYENKLLNPDLKGEITGEIRRDD